MSSPAKKSGMTTGSIAPTMPVTPAVKKKVATRKKAAVKMPKVGTKVMPSGSYDGIPVAATDDYFPWDRSLFTAPAARFIEYKVNGDEPLFYETICIINETNGVMACQCGGRGGWVTWCDHIQYAMEQRLDGKDVTNLYHHILVPIVPTVEFYASVGLAPTDADGFRSVVLGGMTGYTKFIKYKDGLTDMVFLDEHVTIGYLTHGEGRMAIRLLVLEYIKSLYRNGEPCKAKCHRAARWSRRDLRNSPLKPSEFIDVWALHAKGMCSECLTLTCDTSSDVPVL